MDVVLVMNGRAASGILANARVAFPGQEVVVVTRDGDTLPAPKGRPTIEVGQFVPEEGATYKVVTNGGTRTQLVRVIRALVEAGAEFRAIDLQRDSLYVLWDYCDGKPSGRLTEAEAEALYHNTAW